MTPTNAPKSPQIGGIWFGGKCPQNAPKPLKGIGLWGHFGKGQGQNT